jgi:hypothetical protein
MFYTKIEKEESLIPNKSGVAYAAVLRECFKGKYGSASSMLRAVKTG